MSSTSHLSSSLGYSPHFDVCTYTGYVVRTYLFFLGVSLCSHDRDFFSGFLITIFFSRNFTLCRSHRSGGEIFIFSLFVCGRRLGGVAGLPDYTERRRRPAPAGDPPATGIATRRTIAVDCFFFFTEREPTEKIETVRIGAKKKKKEFKKIQFSYVRHSLNIPTRVTTFILFLYCFFFFFYMYRRRRRVVPKRQRPRFLSI